jgi:hypothetical protein
MIGPVLQTTTERATAIAAELGGLAVLAGTLAAVVALLYRWLTRERVPAVLALLFGLSAVAIYLNTTTALDRTIAGDTAITAEFEVALFNIGAFLAGTAGGIAGQRAGDRFAADVLLDRRGSDVDEEVNRLVRTVGRVTTVTLPETIDDVIGNDPIPETTRETLAGREFVFPKNLTLKELRDRLVSRLKADYGVGTVDVELGDDGTVEYLAVGSRAAGIGPTLPPATNAVAIRADPAFAASAGDVVQVWETDPMRRVLTAELRGVADDVVTIAIDAADTPKLDPQERYRLVTLPVEDRPDREFASLLRAADETFSTVTAEAGSPLHGMPVGALDLTVVAVEPADGTEPPVALPDARHVLAPGEVVYGIAQPERLRRLADTAEPLDPSLVRDVGRPSLDRETDAPGTTRAEESQESGTPDRASQEPETPETRGQEPETPDKTGQQSGGPDTATEVPEPSDAGAAEQPAPDESGESGTADGSVADADGSVAGGSGANSFDDLKAEFESGEADWEGEPESDDPSTGDDPIVGDSTDQDDEHRDDDVEPIELDGEEDDDADGDDLLGLDSENEISFDDADDGESTPEDAGQEDPSGDGDGSDDEDDGGGSKTFAQLKEEFESGDADWEDEVSDSPGGDMRLDE